MKVKTSELSGVALAWVVADIEGWDPYVHQRKDGSYELMCHTRILPVPLGWEVVGPIIEREDITVGPNTRPVMSEGNYKRRASPRDPSGEDMYGPTDLIAAQRCYVASRLGDVVDVPEELP